MQGTYQCGELPVWTVHCPLGYLGNATVIEGDDGLILYDTGVNAEAGAHIASEIRKISDKPIKAIFYSHHHADHYNGTSAIVDEADVASGDIAIYAWDNFEAERANEFGEIVARQALGVAYYGGALLPAEDMHHHGIGTDAARLLVGVEQLVVATEAGDRRTTAEPPCLHAQPAEVLHRIAQVRQLPVDHRPEPIGTDDDVAEAEVAVHE